MPLERLEAQICELAGHLAAATCRFLVLLGDFDARRGWASLGDGLLRAVADRKLAPYGGQQPASHRSMATRVMCDLRILR